MMMCNAAIRGCAARPGPVTVCMTFSRRIGPGPFRLCCGLISVFITLVQGL